MSSSPEPLTAGTLLGQRFLVRSVIGSGGFGIAYLADDLQRGDTVVVKELAPVGTHRGDGELLNLADLGEGAAQRLRRKFMEEAKLLSRLNVYGVPRIRHYASENGTAYYVTEYFPHAETLDKLLKLNGRFTVEQAKDVLLKLLSTLEAIHARGVLHRDIKPSNILLDRSGAVYLIDFGAAREWHADMTEHHTVLFTPGFAPLEQLSERARRGPATDLYALSATIYSLLTGQMPPATTDRINGVGMPALLELRPDLDRFTACAIEAGLQIYYEERPPTVEAFRDLLIAGPTRVGIVDLETVDRQLDQLKHLRFGKKECPSCHQLMADPKPLRRHVCAVCREGLITKRLLHASLCPHCKSGTLNVFENEDPLSICPICDVGVLTETRRGFLKKNIRFDCGECGAGFVMFDGEATVDKPSSKREVAIGTHATWLEWGAEVRRSSRLSLCDSCGAQFDHESDGQWRQVVPPPQRSGYLRLYPDEWARIAAGLEPGSGTHQCSSCEADYFVEGEKVTLLGAFEDHFSFAENNVGRLLSWEALQWMGAGKESAKPGLTCSHCFTEFDSVGEFYRLIRTHHPMLRRHLDQLQTFADWHRLSLQLPLVHEEDAFYSSVDQVIRDAFRQGELNVDDKGTIWKGSAQRLAPDEAGGTMIVTDDTISFGGRIRKDRIEIETLADVQVHDDHLFLQVRGSREFVEFEVEEIHLHVDLLSGTRVTELSAADLAVRIDRSRRNLDRAVR